MKLKITFILIMFMLVTGCASKPKSNSVELVGMIIDENNLPVKDFIVHCETDTFGTQIALTNENGLFVFPKQKKGKCFISGEKNGYAIMEPKKYKVGNNNKIFCCQISSCESVLGKVLQKFKCSDYEGGMNLLNDIYCEENSYENKVVSFYKKYSAEKNKN